MGRNLMPVQLQLLLESLDDYAGPENLVRHGDARAA
jgi:hypothetical protein